MAIFSDDVTAKDPRISITSIVGRCVYYPSQKSGTSLGYQWLLIDDTWDYAESHMIDSLQAI